MNKTFLSLYFTFITIMFNKSRYTDNRKGSPRHFIAYMEKGYSKIVSKNITLFIEPGDVFYIPKGLPYQSYWNSADEIKFKSLGFDFFPEWATNDYILQKIKCSDELIEKIKIIPTNVPISSEALGRFYSVLGDLLPNMKYDDVNRQKAIIEMAKNYIIKNPHCKTHDIAKHCLISESALYNLFKKENLTPNTLRQKILCEKSVILLTTTNKSVQEISDALGFSSTSYFRKILKTHIGKTPLEIRKESAF